MKKIGLFSSGILMNTYPNEPEYWKEALDDCAFAIEETGILHELKLIEEEDIMSGKYKKE